MEDVQSVVLSNDTLEFEQSKQVDKFNGHYKETIIDYYSQAGMDYEPWSTNFNMHFGYFSWGLNPFNREALLNEMNLQVCRRLSLVQDRWTNNKVIDLGCGVGATARFCVQHYKSTQIQGVTIVPWQIDQAQQMTSELDANCINYDLADYSNLPYPEQSFNGAYALESSCYDHGSDKLAFLKEAYRVLKPGARLVVADGFRKTKKANGFFEFCYKQVCKGWSLDTFANIHDFKAAMQAVGFKDIVIEDISWKISPSVMHVPWVSLKYVFTHLLARKGNKKFQWLHLLAPVVGLIVGLHRKHYAYYLVSASK